MLSFHQQCPHLSHGCLYLISFYLPGCVPSVRACGYWIPHAVHNTKSRDCNGLKSKLLLGKGRRSGEGNREISPNAPCHKEDGALISDSLPHTVLSPMMRVSSRVVCCLSRFTGNDLNDFHRFCVYS